MDAILDLSARTNFRQCIPLVSQTTDYRYILVYVMFCYTFMNTPPSFKP